MVTDRTDLDSQITNTFKKCGREVMNATTGTHLVELLVKMDGLTSNKNVFILAATYDA
jgi:type I site-specific restriction-modification system R (restriction) subunit